MIESEMFVKEVQDDKMTSINILNWYRNFYRSANNNTEQGVMVNTINDIFMRLKDIGVLDDERLNMSNEDYKQECSHRKITLSKEAIKDLAWQVIRLADIVNSVIKKHEYNYCELQEMRNATFNLISELTQEDI